VNGDPLVELLNSVLCLAVGESRVLRENHLPLSNVTVHRYRDGWTVLTDAASDRHAFGCAFIGWRFTRVEDLADFLTGDLNHCHTNFLLEGEDA
jgi:hypothetical protein